MSNTDITSGLANRFLFVCALLPNLLPNRA